jgi:hypothetical protein
MAMVGASGSPYQVLHRGSEAFPNPGRAYLYDDVAHLDRFVMLQVLFA